MFDPIVLASAAATWVINKLLDSLSKAAIKALLKKEDLDQEVEKLKNALQRANLVLGAVPVGVAAGVKNSKLRTRIWSSRSKRCSSWPPNSPSTSTSWSTTTSRTR
ncbi:uncharacterized protein LOC120686232 [Panicum virgatum]|uniref:uncharacterized protein LOC120686232 n=1 Tax=Panicum virgatum TaxID=38727 RepID=UPI0019D65B7C|nr:uncharacterized protein LOC120686232 [Panicum virgatum]